MTEVEEKSREKGNGILELLQDEVDTIKKKLPKKYDRRAKFLAIMYPVVEVVLMICGDWTDQVKQTGKGRKRISHTSLMLLNILAKMLNVSYRQVIRELNEHPTWLKVLKLNKVPSHNKLSEFRTEMGASFFKDFFSIVRDLLHDLNLIEGEEGIADSAPISASMNFAKANMRPKIDEVKVKAFFEKVDVSFVSNKLKSSRKSKYYPESLLKLFMFEKMCGFLSRAQVLNFLKENPPVAEFFGFPGGTIPSQATLTYFTKKHGDVSKLLKSMVGQVASLLGCADSIPPDSDMNFFLEYLG